MEYTLYIYGTAIVRIVLYGAYVCGDFDGQSGIDIAAIVHGERAALQKLLKKVWDESAELDSEYRTIVSSTVISYGEFSMTITEIMKKIVDISYRYKAKEVILFGSRAKGTETERSDIDIALTGCESFELCKEEIENIPTLYSIDVINMDTCGNDLLLEDIKKYGKKIYQTL